MPRSSKHKSGKHGSRDAREYSDSEKDSSLKDRRGTDENAAKASKDTEKRKLDSKDGNDVRGSGNGEYSDEYASSKRRKEGGGGDRWNGGGDDRGEGWKKSKASGDSKRRRRDESVGVYGEGEEVKRSSGKGDGKHKDSLGRKESREGGSEKDRKFKEGISDESVDYEEQRVSKHQFENTDSRKVDELQSPELDNQLERQMRKKSDDSGDSDKHQVDVGDGYDRHLSSRNDSTKDGRKKDDRRKDEKYRDRYREEMDWENKHRQDKQRDEHPAKDHSSSRSGDKHVTEEKSLESRQRRTKLPESDRYHDLESSRDHERCNDCNQVRAQDCDYDLDNDRDYDRDRELDWDRDQDRDCDRDRDLHRHRDCDGLHVDDRSGRSKEGGTKKRTLDDCDDYSESKSSLIKYPDAGRRSLSSRTHSDVDRGRSQLRQAYPDSSGTSNKLKSSPASNPRIDKNEYRNASSEDPKSRGSVIEQRTKGSREGSSGISERGPKYQLMGKPTKIDESLVGDLSTERCSSVKASRMGLVERSPSSSIERRYMNKSSVKRILDIDKSGRKTSIDTRDFSISDDRLGRELTLEKPPLLDGTSQADSSSYGRTGQGGNSSLIPPPPAFRAALDRPFMGPLEDDVRDSSNTRYRRNSDTGFGRMHGVNSWRAVPNWPSPVPNGFVPFPHGPAHGGFQTLMPSFTSQPLFGVGPPMEVNHAGIPYRITDADMFPGHFRPIGWQNLMDGTGPGHLHGWDNNNGVFRDDAHMFGGSDWDRNRHSTNSQGWESVSETWKEQDSDSKKDLPSPACKDESVPALVDNGLPDQAVQMSQDEHNHDKFHEKSPETKLSRLISPANAPLNSLPAPVLGKVPDTSSPSENTPPFSSFYLSKLDISVDLVLPELYDQCMSALNLEKNASIDVDASTEPFLKNDSSAQRRYTTALSRHSPFPAIDNSIFQTAIDLYKKQRMQQPNVGKVDIILASYQVQLDESVPIPASKDRQITVSVSDGMEDVLMPALGSRKVETPSPAKEHLEESNQTCNQTEEDHNHTHSAKIAISSPSSINEKQGEPVAVLCGKEDEVTSDKVNLGVAEEFCPIAVENESELAPTLHDEVDNLNSKAEPSGFAHSADEKVEIMVNPSIYEDGSPKACDALMPGSNESESLILNRIHHSPESTH